jgi:tetratricopeptide (TPR) repeat protein
MTDHRIQRKPPADDLTKSLSEAAQLIPRRPALYYPEQMSEPERGLYLGVAWILNSNSRREGIELLEKRLQIDTPAKALAVLGEGYLAEGRASQATDVLRKALAKDPSLPKARYNLAQALEAAGLQNESRAEYEQALSARTMFPEAEFALANLLMKMGEKTSAVAHYQSALRIRPTYSEAHSNLGNLYA